MKPGRTVGEAIKAALKSGSAVVGGTELPTIGTSIPVEPVARMRLVIEISPLRIVSEANAGGSLRAKIARKLALKRSVERFLPDFQFPLPCRVTLVRIGTKEMDCDNNAISVKWARDSVAKWLGIDDRDKRVKWIPKQAPGYAGGLRIIIEQAD